MSSWSTIEWPQLFNLSSRAGQHKPCIIPCASQTCALSSQWSIEKINLTSSFVTTHCFSLQLQGNSFNVLTVSVRITCSSSDIWSRGLLSFISMMVPVTLVLMLSSSSYTWKDGNSCKLLSTQFLWQNHPGHTEFSPPKINWSVILLPEWFEIQS